MSDCASLASIVTSLISAGIALASATFAYRASRTAQQSLTLADKVFVAAHRPRILVRSMTLHKRLSADDSPLHLSWDMVNTGDTPATLRELRCAMRYIKPDDPLDLKAWLSSPTMLTHTLASGEFYTHAVDVPDDQRPDVDMAIGHGNTQAHQLIVIGSVVYADDQQRLRNSVMSIAVLIYLAAHVRKASASALFMIHKSSTAPNTNTTVSQLQNLAQNLSLEDMRTEGILREHLHMPEAVWERHRHENVTFNADESVHMGLVHEVSDFRVPLGAQLYNV